MAEPPPRGALEQDSIKKTSFSLFSFWRRFLQVGLPSFLQRACPQVVLPLRFEVHFGTSKIHQISTQNGAKNNPKSIPERPGDALGRPWGAVACSVGPCLSCWLHFGTLFGPFGTIFGSDKGGDPFEPHFVLFTSVFENFPPSGSL